MNSVFAQSQECENVKLPPFYPSVLFWILLSVLGACSSDLQAIIPASQQFVTPVSSTAELSSARVDASKTFTSTRYGVRIDYPANLKLRRTFKRSYLQNGSWKTYLGANA